MKKAIFTICAKNYLAQALVLRESIMKHNPSIDFYLYLSDLKGADDDIPVFVEELHANWVPKWKEMAFKYNVIEFSTSIKPFCFAKLFSEGYEKVIYLDPDIYVTADLQPVWDMLDEKSIVLTPHYCNIQTQYTGAVTEEEILFVGIYNLGFVAICKNKVGNAIIDWWCNRLVDKCYADHRDALHVDQRWMDFIPAFFPNDTHITHHMGINPAIWNLHERELIIMNDKYAIRNIETDEVFPLLFFHFSGFDPFNTSVLNRRHPKFGVEIFSSVKPLIEEYAESIYSNKYEKYSKLKYSFNAFADGENIMPIHRRLYRVRYSIIKDEEPFAENSKMRLLLSRNKMLANVKSNSFKLVTDKDINRKGYFLKVITSFLKVIKRIIGIRYYSALLSTLSSLARYESQTFLLKK